MGFFQTPYEKPDTQSHEKEAEVLPGCKSPVPLVDYPESVEEEADR
jgi:hypothetical protein